MEKKLRVIVADTGEHFGQPCAAIMREHGLEVDLVEKDGRKLVDRIAALRPDAVVMDFFLPQLDAVGVMEQVRATHPVKLPLFMVMSGFDNAHIERDAMLGGADYYFLGPVKFFL